MKQIEYCMQYDTCKRCPMKKRCDLELKQLEKHKDNRKERKERRKAKGSYDV